jgi:hypothetical protein
MPKRLVFLAAALALFGASAAFILWRSDRLESSQPLKGVAPDSVSKIQIERQGAASLVLSKDAGIWHLTSPLTDLADGGQCAELVQALTTLSIGSQVSDDPDHYDLYDLTEASAVHLKVFTRDRAASVLDAFFGKAALGLGTLYLRYAREKPVYLEQGLDPGILRRSADEYRERALFPNDLAPIRTLKLSAGAKILELKESDPEWVTELNLRAADFVSNKAPDNETGLDSPVLIIEAAGSARHARWLIGKPKAEKKGKPAFRYARTDDRPGILALVATYDMDLLFKKIRLKP